jgi:hypothetical protein
MAYTVKVQMRATRRRARARTRARTCIRARTRTRTQDFDKATDSIVMKSKVDIAARRYLGLKLGIPDLLHSDFLDVSTHEYPMVVSTTGDLRLVRVSCLALLRTPEHSRSTLATSGATQDPRRAESTRDHLCTRWQVEILGLRPFMKQRAQSVEAQLARIPDTLFGQASQPAVLFVQQ